MRNDFWKKELVLIIIIVFVGTNIASSLNVGYSQNLARGCQNFNSNLYSSGGNEPPSKPSITGETFCVYDFAYSYSVISTDPDTENISYEINWGDGSSDVIQNAEQSVVQQINHTWNQKGNYTVQARAYDGQNYSDWTPLTVLVLKEDSHLSFILGFIKNKREYTTEFGAMYVFNAKFFASLDYLDTQQSNYSIFNHNESIMVFIGYGTEALIGNRFAIGLVYRNMDTIP